MALTKYPAALDVFPYAKDSALQALEEYVGIQVSQDPNSLTYRLNNLVQSEGNFNGGTP